MAEEVKYNNTLVSGRADETLTYTKYVKDESSGKSTKELLDEKVNKTDKLGTTQIADKAVTNEKLAEHSVDNSKLSPDSVSYDKIQNDAVITEKIQDNAVTTEKVAEKAITNTKLGDQSVDGRVVREASLETKHFANESVTTEKVARKSITNDKLADNAVDASQVVDGSIGNSKLSPDSVTTEKIKDSSITNGKVADDTLGIEKFDPELRKTIQAATGLPEDLSQMIQDVDKSIKQLKEKDTDLQSQINDKQQQITANDGDISLLQTRSTQMEKAIKGISASGGASQASAVTYENTESGLDSVTAQGAIDELARKKFDKENISQEFGDSEDKVVSQFALPFREIESPEFIKTIVDSEDHFLFGIQLDGSIEWGKGIPAPIRAKLQEIIKQCQQDKTDILEAVNAAKEELSASITALQKSKVDKEEGKSLIDDEVKECFRVIENEEFIKAIVDSDDKVLFGFYRATGKPYYPLNEMYHVEQNEEFFALWQDAANHVLLGIRRDGQIIGEINAVNALKQVIAQLQSDVASLQEKVGSTIDTNLKELLDVFSLQENPEYMAVETDAEGKILSSTNPDGSHYIHNAKSETIPEEFSHIEDPEDRTEITTDAEGRLLSYRGSDGMKNELAGLNSSQYYKNNEKKEWIEEKDVVPIVKNTNGDIPLNILDGVTDHNTINLLVTTEIQKTFNDGVNNFTPPNAGYELSNRIECKAGDWFTRTGTATGMIIVTDANDKNGKRLFAPDGSTLGSTFQIPANLTDVRYVRMAVEATSAKAGEVAICRGKNAFIGEQKGDFLTIDKLRVSSSNMPKDLKYLKTSNGDYYELYIDESDFSLKIRKIDPSVITELPDDFPIYQYNGDFSKYFNSWVAMSNGYLMERNQNGVTNFLKLAANAYYYAEFRKETTPGGELRYIAMFPYTSYTGLKGEKGLTIYNKDFDVIDTNIKVDATPDAHDFIYFDDNHLIVCSYNGSKDITINHSGEAFTKLSQNICIQEIKKINGVWKEIASFNTNDYPLLLTDGIHVKAPIITIHWNTVQLDYDGNIIVNMRDMNCFWKIKRTVDSEGNVIIGSKTKDYNEAVIGRVGGIYNSAYIDTKRVLEEGFKFTDVPSSLTDISSDEIPLWKFYHEHDVTYWGMKEINGKEYPTYILFDNNMWTGETPTGNYYDINPRNNYKNNPNGNDDHYFVTSKSDGGAYDGKMVSRIVQLSIDWNNHIIKGYKVYEIPKKYSYTRSSVQMFDEGILFISWADQGFCGLFDFNNEQTVIEGNLYKNGKMLFSSTASTYRVHGYK